jgi:hypothetical protein
VQLGGRAAIMFSSPGPLTVSQRPAAGLGVRLTGSGFAQPLALPYPDMGHVRLSLQVPVPARADAETPASLDGSNGTDIYVYL